MLTKNKAIAKLQQQINEIEELKNKPNFSPEYKKWHRDTEVAIENIFGQGTRHVSPTPSGDEYVHATANHRRTNRRADFAAGARAGTGAQS